MAIKVKKAKIHSNASPVYRLLEERKILDRELDEAKTDVAD